MGISTSLGARVRATLTTLGLLCAPLLLAACAVSAYAGISLVPGGADPELQALARRAQAGDRSAQLALGIRYEEGRGVAKDLIRAGQLYRSAATNGGGTIPVYSPPVSPRHRGRIILVNVGRPGAGLEEARLRLARLGLGTLPSDLPQVSPAEPIHQSAEPPTVSQLDDGFRQIWPNVVRLVAGAPSGRALLGALSSSLDLTGDAAVRSSSEQGSCSGHRPSSPFPVVRAACEGGGPRFFVVHIEREQLTASEPRNRERSSAGCFTVANAFSTAFGLHPRYFYPDVSRGRPPGLGAALAADIMPRVVHRSDSGMMIYVDFNSQSECLSSFFVFAPLR